MNFKIKILLITLISITIPYQTFGYVPMTGKDHYISDVLLRDLVDRMGKDLLDTDDVYVDPLANMPSHLALMSRASKDLEAEQIDYDSLLDGANTNPSLRDQEYMQHSSLWGHQYMSGGGGEGPHRIKPQIKTDASLPAYCNPPNPCPYGYTEDQACVIDFENTAAFSRDYQSSQECMCDAEHMFDCPGNSGGGNSGSGSGVSGNVARSTNDQNDDGNNRQSDLESFLARQFHAGEHKNLVAKKFHPSTFNHHNEMLNKEQLIMLNENNYNNNDMSNKDQTALLNEEQKKNPFLQGEKLPVAAKKGKNVY